MRFHAAQALGHKSRAIHEKQKMDASMKKLTESLKDKGSLIFSKKSSGPPSAPINIEPSFPKRRKRRRESLKVDTQLQEGKNVEQIAVSNFEDQNAESEEEPSIITSSDSDPDDSPHEDKNLKKFEANGKIQYLDKNALYLFKRSNAFRQFCYEIISNKWFENVIMTAIIGNSVVLALNDYEDEYGQWNQKLNTLGNIFTWLFFTEAILKIIAMGFIVTKNSYMRDGWNCVDFVIAISGVIEFFAEKKSLNIKSLRVLRVIRPLKSINAIPSMRQLVHTLISSLPELGHVTLFLAFIFILFGILGLQEFSGLMYNRCRLTDKPVNSTYWPVSEEHSYVCSKKGSGGLRQCPEDMVCGNPLDYGIPLEFETVYQNAQIQYGIASFDNFFSSLLAVFQILTKDSWTTIMYNLMNGTQYWMAIFYCTFLIIFGSFFLLNLVLAVIMQAFINTQEMELVSNESNDSEDKEQDEEKGSAVSNETPLPGSKVLDKTKILRRFSSLRFGQTISNQLSNQLQHAPAEIDEQSPLAKLIYRQKVQTPSPYIGNRQSVQHAELPNCISPQLRKRMNKDIYRKNKQRLKAEIRNPTISIVRKMEIAGQYGMFDQTQFKSILQEVIQNEDIMSIASPGIASALPAIGGSSESNLLPLQKMVMSLKIQNKIKELARARLDQTILSQNQVAIPAQSSHGITVFKSDQTKLPENLLLKRAQREGRLIQCCIAIIKSKAFVYFINGIIILNTITLAQDRYPFENTQEQFLEQLNLGFFAIFLVEMVLKIVGMGFKLYIKEKFNIFDSVIVAISTVDIVIYYTSSQTDQAGGAISALRAFRLLRIFKLAQSWMQFQYLLITIGNTMKDISNFSVLLFLFMFVYSLLGMELFAYKVKFDENDSPVYDSEGSFPDSTFNNFLESFVSVFITLANDGWSTIYINHYRSQGAFKATLFFISLLIVGQYILLNLFLAILIRNFDEQSLEQEIIKSERKLQGIEPKSFWRCGKPKKKINKVNSDENEAEEVVNYSLCLFSSEGTMRKAINKFVYNKKFEVIIVIFIIMSSVLLAFDDPLSNEQSQVLKVLDIVFSGIFTLEAILKIIAHGLIANGEHSYLQKNWNILDFVIVVLSIISIFFGGDTSAFKIIRLIKVLRPLRMISKNQGLQISIKALFKSIPNIFNVLLISIIFFFIFGILGVNYLKGTYYTCRFHEISGPDEQLDLVRDKWDCYNYGGQWIRDDNNFDNIFQAILTLFQMAITVGWAKQMYLAMWTKGIDQVREPGSNKIISLFFIAYIVVCSFFILNLFVGVVITTYNREKEKLGKNFLLTESQKKWLDIKLLIIEAKPKFYLKKPKNKIRLYFYGFVQHRYFERFIITCIVLNTLVLCNKWYGQSNQIDQFNDKLNIGFAWIFTLEIVLKLTAFGKRFFKDGWNIFDLIIVIGAWFGLLLSNFTNLELNASTLVIRAFRICRMFKLFRRFRSLKIIFQTFIVTLPALANVGSLLFLLLYIYSILGVFLFAEVKMNYPMNENLNFSNLGYSLLTMIRVSTGENWHELMHALGRDENSLYQCIYSPTYKDYVENDYEPIGCGSYYTSLTFFVSFIIIVSLVFLNLFVAIILEGFDDTNQKDKKLFNHETTEYFRDVWSRFDPNATCFMRVKDFPKLMLSLGAPIGWDASFKDNQQKQKLFIRELNLQSYNGFKKYQFMNVLENLALNMIVNKEVECILKSQNTKSDQEKVNEIKEEINAQIKMAEENKDAQMARIVRKRTLTRLNTIKSEAENAQAYSDQDDNDSELIQKHIIDAQSVDRDSSQIRASRSVSFMHQQTLNELINNGVITQQAKDKMGDRAQFLKNLEGSFEEANESSIGSWGQSPASIKKSKQSPMPLKQVLEEIGDSRSELDYIDNDSECSCKLKVLPLGSVYPSNNFSSPSQQSYNTPIVENQQNIQYQINNITVFVNASPQEELRRREQPPEQFSRSSISSRCDSECSSHYEKDLIKESEYDYRPSKRVRQEKEFRIVPIMIDNAESDDSLEPMKQPRLEEN